MTNTLSETAPVTTGLYIGGQVRSTEATLEVLDPARPGVVVGHAAAATEDDVAAAVAAAKSAYPAWSALSATERAARMAEAIEGIADERDEDARVLSLENGKIRMEAWVDALVFEIRWQLALSLAGEVEKVTVLPPALGIPVKTTVAHQSIGVVRNSRIARRASGTSGRWALSRSMSRCCGRWLLLPAYLFRARLGSNPSTAALPPVVARVSSRAS